MSPSAFCRYFESDAFAKVASKEGHRFEKLFRWVQTCSVGRLYLYWFTGGGQAGVEYALSNMRNEIELSMTSMGVRSLKERSSENLRRR